MKDQIETLEQDNAETLRQIMQDAHDEKVAIAEKNRTALKNVKDMGLMSTAELQNKKNKLQDLKAETELVERQIKDKGQQLENQKKLTEEKQTQALENLQEIHNQDNKIAFRERSILYLKKKTQELEKFKFVLDYCTELHQKPKGSKIGDAQTSMCLTVELVFPVLISSVFLQIDKLI